MPKTTCVVRHTFTTRYDERPTVRVVEVHRHWHEDVPKYPPSLVVEYAHHTDAMGNPAWHPVEWHKPLPRAIQALAERAIKELATRAAEAKANNFPEEEGEAVKPA